MFYKTIYVFYSLLFYINVYAYEMPKVDISQSTKPAIILFNAQSIVVNNSKQYKLIWKTENATHAQLTFLGNVELSGNIIISEKEYQHGPITLTVTSIHNSFADSKTINKFVKSEQEAPIIIRKENKNINHEIYQPIPYGRGIAPRRYRRY